MVPSYGGGRRLRAGHLPPCFRSVGQPGASTMRSMNRTVRLKPDPTGVPIRTEAGPYRRSDSNGSRTLPAFRFELRWPQLFGSVRLSGGPSGWSGTLRIISRDIQSMRIIRLTIVGASILCLHACHRNAKPETGLATPAVTVSQDKVSLGSPIDISYKFVVAPDAPRF